MERYYLQSQEKSSMRTPWYSKIIFVTFVIGSIGLNISHLSANSEKVKTEIKKIVSAQHPFDDATVWKGLGPETPKVLIELFQNENEQPYEKLRYLQALAWFSESKEAVDFLKMQASQSEDRLVRVNAIHTLVRSQGENAISFTEDYLTHSDLQTRMAAALALLRLAKEEKSAKAQALVDSFKSKNSEKWILEKLSLEEKRIDKKSGKDKLDSLMGVWKGFWVEPDQSKSSVGSSTELVSLPATISIIRVIDKGAESEIKISLEVKMGNEKKIIEVKKFALVEGKGPIRFNGQMENKSIEGELRFEMGSEVVNLRRPDTGTVIIAKKVTKEKK